MEGKPGERTTHCIYFTRLFDGALCLDLIMDIGQCYIGIIFAQLIRQYECLTHRLFTFFFPVKIKADGGDGAGYKLFIQKSGKIRQITEI